MKMAFVFAALAATLATGAATAQDASYGLEIGARKGIMDYRQVQLGVLGAMAKGDVEYNAEAAQKAADALLAAATIDVSMLWPKGSDSDANADTRALPAIWAEGSDIGAKAMALVEAATAMQAAAGTGLDALKDAMQGVGGACVDCHKTYRKSAG